MRTRVDFVGALPPGQLRCWRAVRDLLRRGCAPTVREIAAHLCVTQTAVHGHLATLRARGYLQWITGQCRTLQICGIPEGEVR